jgi:hypothetical protein
VVTIATWGYDARDWVTALRGPGQWFGDIVVLSDGCAPDPEDYRIVRVDSGERGPGSALAAKHLKTRLFELAAPTSSTALLFMNDHGNFENWLAGRFASSAVPLIDDVVESSEMARQNGKELSYQRNRQGQVCVGVYGHCCGSIVAKKLASLGRSSTRFH